MIASYDQKNLPLDSVWLGAAYTDKYKAFSVDTKAFDSLNTLAANLHESGRHIVPVLQGGISCDDPLDPYYQSATTAHTLIQSTEYPNNNYNGNLISKQLANKVAFVDWFNSEAYGFWSKGLSDLYAKVPFDGVWLDMNEPATYKDGEYSSEELKGTTDMRSGEGSSSDFLRCKIY